MSVVNAARNFKTQFKCWQIAFILKSFCMSALVLHPSNKKRKKKPIYRSKFVELCKNF